jgi:hypothetical protein
VAMENEKNSLSSVEWARITVAESWGSFLLQNPS